MRHLKDLASMCFHREYPVFSDFLNLNEQSIFLTLKEEMPTVSFCFDGGYPFAERKVVCFTPAGVGYECPAPLCLLRIYPVQMKFAEKLSHRDYLGTLLGLGIDRSKIGDILIQEEGALVFCVEGIASYIEDNLERIRHTRVKCSREETATFSYEPRFKRVRGSIASSRLDTVISLAFGESRSGMAGLIKGEKVFVNGKMVSSASYLLKENETVSVRGYGKFIYRGLKNQTKKGRYFAEVDVFV